MGAVGRKRGADLGSSFPVEAAENGLRLDVFLTKRLSALNRSKVQALIKGGAVVVNGKKGKAGQRLAPGDQIVLLALAEEVAAIKTTAGLKQPDRAKLIFSDAAIVVLNKPAGVAVEGVAKSGAPLFAAWLREQGGELAQQPDLVKEGATRYPGLVHRLDKQTSGVMVVAKTSQALRNLKQQFKQHKVEKRYQALVVGRLSVPLGQIEAPLLTRARAKGKVRVAAVASAKVAVTNYQVEEQLGEFTLLSLQPLTGRTHQIRVHLRAIGHPILGDPIYGSRRWNRWAKKRLGLERPFLHAHELSFRHPLTKEQVSFKAPLAKDLKVALAALP